MRPGIVLVWVGALLVIAGLIYMAAQPLRARLSSGSRAGAAGGTLEPGRPSRGFGLASNWPGLALAGVGAVLLLAAAAF